MSDTNMQTTPLTADDTINPFAAQPSEKPRPAKTIGSAATATLRWFRATYPVIEQNLPLMIGVGDTLREAAAAAGHDPTAAALALRIHCSGPRYLANAAADDAMRHDLSGLPVAPVNQAHRDHAAQRRGDSVAKAIRRFEAQRQERAAKAKKAAASRNAKPPKPSANDAGAGTAPAAIMPAPDSAASSETPTTVWGRPLPVEPSPKPLGLSLRKSPRSTKATPPVVVRLKSRKPVQRR